VFSSNSNVKQEMQEVGEDNLQRIQKIKCIIEGLQAEKDLTGDTIKLLPSETLSDDKEQVFFFCLYNLILQRLMVLQKKIDEYNEVLKQLETAQQ
jgi:hypothetical protein